MTSRKSPLAPTWRQNPPSSFTFGETAEVPIAPRLGPPLLRNLRYDFFMRKRTGCGDSTTLFERRQSLILFLRRSDSIRRAYRRGRTTGVRRAAFKSCCNKAISDGVSIRGVFEVASFRPGKFVEAKSVVLPSSVSLWKASFPIGTTVVPSNSKQLVGATRFELATPCSQWIPRRNRMRRVVTDCIG